MKLLMCRPDFFDIEYEINPWMSTDNLVDRSLAIKQWESLYSLYTDTLGWEVELIEPVEGLPDMVFTANGGLVVGGKVALPTFRQPERMPETSHFKAWFESKGFSRMLTPKHDFEGEGDALLWNDTLFIGYPWRSDQAVQSELEDFLGVKVVGMQLADARFYHLDTCLAPIDSDTVAIWPPAFTDESVQNLKNIVPNVVEASESDALAYGLNSVSNGKTVVLSEAAHGLIQNYIDMGKEVYPTAIGEFQKSGGGVKCLTLDIARDS